MVGSHWLWVTRVPLDRGQRPLRVEALHEHHRDAELVHRLQETDRCGVVGRAGREVDRLAPREVVSVEVDVAHHRPGTQRRDLGMVAGRVGLERLGAPGGAGAEQPPPALSTMFSEPANYTPFISGVAI